MGSSSRLRFDRPSRNRGQAASSIDLSLREMRERGVIVNDVCLSARPRGCVRTRSGSDGIIIQVAF